MPFDPTNYEGQDRLQHIEKYVGQATTYVANPNLLGQALGVQFEPYPAFLAATSLAPPTQTVRGIAVYATAGATITGVKMRLAVAAAGSLPTTARFGLADSTGKMLARSGNLTALANWVTGPCPMPFTTPFQLPYTGVYFPCFVVDGTWGSTQPTPVNVNGGGTASNVGDGTAPPWTFIWGGQTDLPAVGSSLTMQNSSIGYYLALY